MNCKSCGSYFSYGFGYGKDNNELCKECYKKKTIPIKPYLRNGKLVKGYYRRIK